jgi:hypothetical protein
VTGGNVKREAERFLRFTDHVSRFTDHVSMKSANSDYRVRSGDKSSLSGQYES